MDAIQTVVTLKKGEGRGIKSGSAWIFDNEIAGIKGRFKNGGLVLVEDFDGYPMGCGFINQNSKIRVRLLSRSQEEINEEFFRKRVRAAWDYRKAVMKSREDLKACRLIFGEADFLPGLTVDRYEDILVAECLALGMENYKELILRLLRECLLEDGFRIRAVYERSDAREREKEGLGKSKGLIWHEEGLEGNFDPRVEICENGVRYLVDVENGQKTGFLLDQKYNRLALQQLVKGALLSDANLGGRGSLKCLDCFTHMGTFALNMGLAGAAEVTGLDISEFAVGQAMENARLNGLSDRVCFRAANVLDELPRLYEAGERYDIVVLDPPAFTKSREATKNAIKGYREVNMKGLRLIRPGGYLATCSCSHFMTQELFTKVIGQAADSVHRRLRQIEFKTQAPDHPILWSANESYYLKFYIFQVC